MTHPLSIEPDDQWMEDLKWEENWELPDPPRCGECKQKLEWIDEEWTGEKECCKNGDTIL
jgi:hypothetical protein